jgi:hypothetical protein
MMNAVNQLGEMKRPSLPSNKNLNKLYIAEFDRPACSIYILLYKSLRGQVTVCVCWLSTSLFLVCVCVSYFFGKNFYFYFIICPSFSLTLSAEKFRWRARRRQRAVRDEWPTS